MNNLDPVETIIDHLKRRRLITNRECRRLLGLSYDQVIFVLGEMCKVGLLVRKGVSSGTHYVLSVSPVPAKGVSELKEKVNKRLL